MNEKVIWDCLLQKVGNERGVAAIMGNLMAESSLNPLCATGKNKTANYAKDADNGAVDFVNDGVAFGLVQWCYHTRKAGLLEYAKKTGRSVGHLQMQLEYILIEMSNYKTAWNAVNNAKDIRTASDIVMLNYENPATKTEAAKQKRAAYGQKFYDQFAKTQQKQEDAAKPQQKTVRTTDTVNIRAGSSINTAKLGKMAKGVSMEWLATENGFHKVAVWISGDFSEVKGRSAVTPALTARMSTRARLTPREITSTFAG